MKTVKTTTRQLGIVHACYENGVLDNRVMDICVLKILTNIFN